ncbi:LOW QUALITY PROTEIN: hypothetical protein N5P37_010425 [Trichoderma harzianum]|nr:LOW QUALITY PROTEIN: hypothetical protein N5P37_010425 [Trichoderma harzianum]
MFMQNLTPLEEARARRFQRASSHHHIDYMHSYTLLNSVTPLALVALNTSRSSIGFKHGSYSVWAYYQNVSNDQQQATKKLWAPDPLLARAHRSGKASCHSSMPIHCTVVQVALSPALTKLDTNKGPPPRQPQGYAKNVLLLVPSTRTGHRICCLSQSAEWRADARVVWRAVASRLECSAESQREREASIRTVALVSTPKPCPRVFWGLTNRPIGGGKGGRSLLRRSDPFKPVLAK